MTLEPNDLLLFARVADEGSFTRAGERLGLPKSTVSRRIAALEASLGERLLQRTTRKLVVTDLGRAVLAHARQVASEVEAAESLAQHRQLEPSGRLRVSMPNDFANIVLGPLMAAFIEDHPAITLEVDLTPRRVDLIGENVDLAIRMGDLPDDASLAARRLAAFTVGLYASPAYLKRRGVPLAPTELAAHDSLRILARNGEAQRWELSDGTSRWEGAPPGRAIANAPELLMVLARAHAGIAALADHFAQPYVRSGELVAVLPAWKLPPADAWIVFPGRRLMPARTRAFIDALQAKFSGPACEAHEAEARAQAAQRRAPAGAVG